jgi:threonine-phosphate decarboxylase
MAELERYGHGGDRLTAAERFGGSPDEFLDFSSNIHPLGPPQRVIEALSRALESGKPAVLTQYPDPLSRRLRNKLAERLDVSPEQLLIGNGAAELIDLAVQVFRPGRVGVVRPCFSEYERSARIHRCSLVSIRAREEDRFIPAEQELCSLIGRSDLVFLGHPNNPTGQCIPVPVLERAADEAARSGTVLVVDEAFIDFVPGGEKRSLIRRLSSFPTTLIVRSMTKFYALPGLRLGYAVGSRDWIERLARHKIPWSVNALAQIAGEAALEDEAYQREAERWGTAERSELADGLQRIGAVDVFPSETNFLLLRLRVGDDHPSRASGWLQEQMGRRGILIRDCSTFPGLDGRYVRVAVRTREENERLLAALREVWAGQEGGGNG